MGWFDEQIRQRKRADQEVFEESFLRLAGVVLGRQAANAMEDRWLVTKQALDEILKYYHYKPAELPGNIKDEEEQLEYLLRPHGLMYRRVYLEDGWHKDSFGPLLAYTKEGKAAALLPKKLGGYYYKEPESGRRTSIGQKTAHHFEKEALCFYRPLPLKKLGIPDLLLYMKGCLNSGDLALILLSALALTLAGMLGPVLSKALTGSVLSSGKGQILLGLSIFMLCAEITSQLLAAIRSLVLKRIQTKVSLSVEAAVMMRILSLPAAFFRGFSAGELSKRASSVNSLCTLLLGSVFSTGLSSVLSLLYIGQILGFAPALLVPSIAIILATVTVSLLSSLLQSRISREQMRLASKESGMAYALVSGIQKIRLSGSEKRAFARWAKLYAEEASYTYNPPAFLKLNSVLTTAIALLGNAALYFLAAKNGITPSTYYAFNASYGMVMAAFSSLAGIALSAAQIRPILEMASPILQEAPEIAEEKEVLTRLSGNIEFNHVFFRYDESMPYVVNDLSLRIRSGEYLAIVGRTGCGKSTLLRLLLGFEKPERGAIYYDGKDMSRIDLKSLRKRIGTVIQNGELFQGDIFSNITISAPFLTLREAWEAAETAGIAEDIRAMPMGMHTVIAEGQGGISGGQKQRLMIARAIAPKPRLLLFDEATSALDNKTQKQVSDALGQLKCTRIVIAHRLSTIKNCDRILVLDQGKIIEDGKYEELLAAKGYFAELVARQRLEQDL